MAKAMTMTMNRNNDKKKKNDVEESQRALEKEDDQDSTATDGDKVEAANFNKQKMNQRGNQDKKKAKVTPTATPTEPPTVPPTAAPTEAPKKMNRKEKTKAKVAPTEAPKAEAPKTEAPKAVDPPKEDKKNNQKLPLPKKSVVCGGHKAASCEKCPQGNGASWCNGECSWCGDREKCQPQDAMCPICQSPETQHNEYACNRLAPEHQCSWCPLTTTCIHVENECPTERVWLPPPKEKWFTPPEPIDLYNKTLSIVLPCGNENDFYERTVRSIFAATPDSILKDIIIVDDNSAPPLESIYTLNNKTKHSGKDSKDIATYDLSKVVFMRSDVSLGLIDAKHQGALLAKGDIIVFFDCHVKPAIGYWEPFVREIAENRKRVVVPSITHLNVDTWVEDQRPKDNLGGNSKCFTTLDGDFKWIANEKPWVPTMSGGLLAIEKDWFFEIGGHDQNMKVRNMECMMWRALF